ncbi:MAG: 50S ribosomal protein L25 [Bacteroidia bacterium]|nr:50S ribosomal protein L25 [Bacteroidia bacterium]MDW8157949.1 50S ribosomal protein L25 [Bacteroidia bacterium]
MNSVSLIGTPRTEMGKERVKQYRKQNLVPCSLYDGGKSTHFTVPFKDLRPIVYTPQVFLIDLSLENINTKCIIKGLQFHPVFDNLLHVEFVKVKDNAPIEVELPVKLVGTAEGVLAGGKLVQKTRVLRVRGIYKNLPTYVEIDISPLKLGRSLKVRELQFDNFTIAMAKDVPIASIEIPRALRQQAAVQQKAKK